MRVLCAISGIDFNCDYFPAQLNSREITHPIFHLKQKKLISFIGKWSAGELTDIDSLLLFLALLNSTDLIEWRVPVFRTKETNSIIANNMEKLMQVVAQINLLKNPNLILPQFVVSTETKSLDNIHYWLQSWESAIDSYKSGYKSTGDWRTIRNRELALERMIKSSTRDISSYAGILADWAEVAGNFPNFDIIDYKNTSISISEYWKLIIKKCCKSESIFEIPKKDIQELIEHCEDNIIHGSIYSHELMKLLRDGLVKQTAFLGVDITATNDFIILDANTSIEDANKLAIINSAPKEIPQLADFKTSFEYMKAKLKYDMAQKYQKELIANGITGNNGEIL